MFVALAFVCDDYFISALDKICQVSTVVLFSFPAGIEC